MAQRRVGSRSTLEEEAVMRALSQAAWESKSTMRRRQSSTGAHPFFGRSSHRSGRKSSQPSAGTARSARSRSVPATLGRASSQVQPEDDFPISFEIAEFLWTQTPPPTSYMSIPYPPSDASSSEDEGHDKREDGSFHFSIRRRQKKSSRRQRPRRGLLWLPDTAVSKRTADGHRHIAISIPIAVADAVPQPWPRALPWETEWTWDKRDVTKPEWREPLGPDGTRPLRAFHDAPTTRTLVSEQGVVTVLKPATGDRDSASAHSLDDLLSSFPGLWPTTAPSRPVSKNTSGGLPGAAGSPARQTRRERGQARLADLLDGPEEDAERPDTAKDLVQERPMSWSVPVPGKKASDGLTILGNSSAETVIPPPTRSSTEESRARRPAPPAIVTGGPTALKERASDWHGHHSPLLSPASACGGSRPVSRSSRKDVDEAYRTVERLVEEASAASRPTSSRTARSIVTAVKDEEDGVRSVPSVTPIMVVASVRPDSPPVCVLELPSRPSNGELGLETKESMVRVISPATIAKMFPGDVVPPALRFDPPTPQYTPSKHAPGPPATDRRPTPSRDMEELQLERRPSRGRSRERDMPRKPVDIAAAAGAMTSQEVAEASSGEHERQPLDGDDDTPAHLTRAGRPPSRSVLLDRQDTHVKEMEQRLRKLERDGDAWRDAMKPLLADLSRKLDRLRAERADREDEEDEDDEDEDDFLAEKKRRLQSHFQNRAVQERGSWYSADNVLAPRMQAFIADPGQAGLSLPAGPQRPKTSSTAAVVSRRGLGLQHHHHDIDDDGQHHHQRPHTAYQDAERGRGRFFLPDHESGAASPVPPLPVSSQRAERSTSTSTRATAKRRPSSGHRRYPSSLLPRSLVVAGTGPTVRARSRSRPGTSRTQATTAEAARRRRRREEEEAAEEERERQTEARIEFLLTPGMVDLSRAARVYHYSGLGGWDGEEQEAEEGRVSGMDTIEPLMRELMGAPRTGRRVVSEDEGSDDDDQEAAFAGF